MQSTLKIIISIYLSLLITSTLHASSEDVSRHRAEAIVTVPWRVVKVVHQTTGDHQEKTKLTLLSPNEDVKIRLTFLRRISFKTTGIIPEYVRFFLNRNPEASRYQVSRYLKIEKTNSNTWYMKKETDEARALGKALHGWGGMLSQSPPKTDLYLDPRKKP